MCTCMYVHIFVCYAFLRDGASSFIPMTVGIKESLSMQSMWTHCQDTFHYHIVHSLQLLQIVSFPLLLSSSIPSIFNVGRIMGDPFRNFFFFSCTAHIRMESSFLSLIISPINVTSSQPWGPMRKKCYPTESSPSISWDFPGSPVYMTLYF